MTHAGTNGMVSDRKGLFAIIAVLIIIFSAFAVIGDRASVASADPEPQTSLEATVVYHASENDFAVDANYNNSTVYTTGKSFTYYGTVISTEYNPQVWEFDRWYSIVKNADGTEKYEPNHTYVFTGWKYATDGSGSGGEFEPSALTESIYDPGDVILYNSSDGHWYADYDYTNSTYSQRVDLDVDNGKIHVYATWGKVKNVATNPSSSLNWSEGSKFQDIVLVTGEKNLKDNICSKISSTYGFTVRASNISNVAASILTDHGEYPVTKPIIIDNISMRYSSGKAGNGMDINANSNVLIIGTGINSIKTNGGTSGYGQYASIYGGNIGNTKVIIHSGVYSCVYGGGMASCISVTIMNGGAVLDTLSGGNPASKTDPTGHLYLYMTGVTTYSDSYTDYLLNHENDGTKIAGTGSTTVIESSMVVGGNACSESDSTHLFLTGTSDVWTIQAAGRADKSTVKGNADMEISGKAVVRNVACGGLTDALEKKPATSTVVGNINITVRDAPLIACLVGGGYDTYRASQYACFFGDERSINVTVNGGTIGYVYGGGLRGPIGTADKPTNINVTVNGGYIVKDVYGGGSGTLVKIKHTDASGTTNTNPAYYDTTGQAYVYGDITINVTDGYVNGNVYGGGKSVAMISNYGGKTDFNVYQNHVASVDGDIEVNISGGEIAGSVFGAGRGMDTSVLIDQNAISSEYSSLYVIRNKTWSSTPVLKDPNNMVRSDVSLSQNLELAYIPWAKQNLNSTALVTVKFKIDSEMYEEYAKVTGSATVNVSQGNENVDCIIHGSVYGGGQIGKLYGTTAVHIYGGTVEGMVYGGGLGTIGRMSVSGIRRVTVGGTAYIEGSVYGGSALGTDGEGDEETFPTGYDGSSDVTIYIKAGTIAGSIFGGGFQGTTYGNVHMYVGVDSLSLNNSYPVLADSESATTVTIGGSIYLGGDVGVLEDSSDAYTKEMVLGGGELFMAQSPSSNNLAFSGTIMGSGNSCLTRGDTTIHLKNLTTFSTAAAEAIHRATTVTIDGCVLELNGRATIENTLHNVADTDYSLYRIEKLILKEGSIFVLNGAINYVYELSSQNDNGDPTTSTSPTNKIVVGGGNMFILKKIEWGVDTYSESYGTVEGYTILAARSNEQQYGVLALGDPESEGGFVVLRSGTFEKADYSDLTETCRCWYLAGAINNEVTVTAEYSEIEDISVDMPSLQSGSSYRYTGGTFIPDSPGDADRISTEETVVSGEFQVRFGCSDGTQNCLVFEDDPMQPEKGALMRNDLGQGDPILGIKTGGAQVRNPYMVIEVKSMISEFRYIGYVIICVNEVVEVSLGNDTGYIVVNSIQTKVHIYTESSSFGSDTSMEISVVDGAGSSIFLIPSGMAGASVVIDSVTPKSGATAVSAFSVTAVKNMNNTPGWTDSLGTFILRTDGSASTTAVGTLQGGYSASMKVQVNSFSGTGVHSYDMAVRIVKNGENLESFILTLNVSKTPDVSVIFHISENTQLKYTYSYGTSITLPDCPPTEDHFVGWYTDPSFNNPYTFTFPLIRDMDLYARYMYEVTMDYMDGTSSIVYVNMPVGYIGTMSDPVRPGYTFGGWYSDTEYQNLWHLDTDPVENSMTLYARWLGWDVKVRFQVDFGAGPTDVYLDPSKAQHHTGDIINCQVMEFGTKFDMSDTFETDSGEKSMTLLDWAQYNLEKMPAYTAGGYKFIYWTYQVLDAPNKAVPVYSDSYLQETGRLLTDGGVYVKENGYYVVILTAKVAKVALRVDMDSTVIEGGQSVDNLALVDPPSSFLIFPYEEVEESYYYMKIELNGATRPGYSLKGWTIADPTDGSAEFVRDEPHLYAAGTKIVLYIYKNTGGDKDTYPWIAEFKVSDATVETMKITVLGKQRMFGEKTDNLVIKFQSEWNRIPYSVSIADPAHGSIVAIYYDQQGNPVQFDDDSFFYGDSVSLIFTPDAGYEFHHWYSSGEGLFNDENSISTTFVVQGDTCISAYLIGPQIVRVFIEYDGLYKEVGVNGKVYDSGTEYTIETVNTDIISTTNGVKFIVTAAGNHATVIYVPAGVTVHVNDTLTVGETDYTVDAITDILEDPENCARFIVTDDVNHRATIVEYYIDESMIPNLFWENGGDRVYFTESVKTMDMGAEDHSLIQYTGTAILGTHDIFIEGRAFNGKYKLGLPITSTTLQNVYYIMTDRTLYSMADIPDGAQTGEDASQHVHFAVTDPSDDGATIATVDYDATEITIGNTVTDGIDTYTVIGIGPDAVASCSSMKILTIHGDVIYRYGYVTVYTNGILNHVTDPSSTEIAGKESGIYDMKEYVLNYYVGDAPEGVDGSSDVTITLQPGYYYYNYPNDSTHIDHSLADLKTITVTGYITNKVVLGTITRAHYTVNIYYGTGTPEESGDPVVETDVYYGDSHLDVLADHTSVPATQFSVYAWYLLPGTNNLISSEMTVTGNPETTIKVFGKYIASTQTTTIWIRTELLNGTYSVSSPQTVTKDSHVYYCVDQRSGYDAKYDTDDGNVVTSSYLETHVYPSSEPVTQNPIDIVPEPNYVIIITYYRSTVNVTIYDANHNGTTATYRYGDTVELVHHSDTVDTHYEGWKRNDEAITVPVEGYSVTLADVDLGSITLREVSSVRKYTVNVVTSFAEIHSGGDNLGKAVSLSVPYGAAVSVDGDYNTILTIDGTDYVLSEYTPYMPYYDMTEGDWGGAPATVTGNAVISYQWVPRTYTLRIVYDETVTVSGTNGTNPMLFSNVSYIVKAITTTNTVASGDYKDVQFIVTDDVNHYATVIYIPDGVTVEIGDHFEYESVTYHVTAIDTTVKETTSGIKFIVTDWAHRYVTVTDSHGQSVNIDDTLVQDGPNHTVTVTPGDLDYKAIIRLTLVFTGSYTLDENKSSYVNPSGGSYPLQPKKQSSLQEWIIQFFVTGDMEITIESKWVGEHVSFFIQSTEGGEPEIDPSMTLLVAKGEPLYIRIRDYEWIERLDIAGYYFDGWYTNSAFTIQPDVAYSDNYFCFKLTGNTSLYARYVPLVSGNYELTYDGTEQYVDVTPELKVPLNVSAVSYTYEGGSGSSVSITDVGDPMNGKAISYTFTPEKVYEYTTGGVTRYVMSGVNHPYTGTFRLVMNARPVIVIANSQTKIYDGSALECDSYSVFGLKGGSLTTQSSVITYEGTALNPGSAACTVSISNTSSNYSITYYQGTLTVIGKAFPKITSKVAPAEIVLSGSQPITVTYSDSSVTVRQGDVTKVTTGNSVKIVLDDISITADSASAVAIGDGCNVALVIKGTCVLNGDVGYDGICVGTGAALTITGPGTLTVTGNGESDASGGGSGIGYVDHTPGDITIDHLVCLNAYGYGEHGYGIGGDGATVVIENSIIAAANGGIVSNNAADIDKEGGPGIGGADITITDSIITSAAGGSNAAGIGSIMYEPTTVTICDSTITSVTGGSYSAGIGGSRQAQNDATQKITIHIEDSSVTATGGLYGAGIGSGYDSFTEAQGLCTIVMTDNVHITATGGKYAASIGTGYRHANLTGYIDGSCSVTTPERSEENMIKSDSPTYYGAQYIGYGVTDPATEASGLVVYFYRALSPIPAPSVPGVNP